MRRIFLETALELVRTGAVSDAPLERCLVRALELETAGERAARELDAAVTAALYAMDDAGMDTRRLKAALIAWRDAGS
jgi:hypothetical protein